MSTVVEPPAPRTGRGRAPFESIAAFLLALAMMIVGLALVAAAVVWPAIGGLSATTIAVIGTVVGGALAVIGAVARRRPPHRRAGDGNPG